MSNTEPWQDKNKKLIVQSNDLITARYDLDIDGFRALTLFLSKVNQRLENPGWVSFTAHEFQITFDINKKNIWRCMKKAVTSLSKMVAYGDDLSLLVSTGITRYLLYQSFGPFYVTAF
ncbi:replication initiation protein [Candidatus Arsenophonus triatominarum]|uniref:replication initiation protein n=1 Tax=Candidatus Arsenophonus triatominarum TaxID=57911 RepID=UPI0007C533BC|nr:replication initiation protein [Candidatus Arsenophonus triatominarum]